MSRALDDEDEITREDFIKLATETKLTEFQVDRDREPFRSGFTRGEPEPSDKKVKKIKYSYNVYLLTNNQI